ARDRRHTLIACRRRVLSIRCPRPICLPAGKASYVQFTRSLPIPINNERWIPIMAIIFISYPETGHLNASFKVARTLRERGKRVYYLGLRDFENDVRRQGFDYLPILEDLCPKGFMQRFAVSNHIDNFSAIMQQANSAQRPLDLQRDIEWIVRRIQPELFVIDLLLTDMALLAEKV